MPFKLGVRGEAEKMVNAIGNVVFPVLVGMCFPVFLYQLVTDKESKILQNMLANGL